MALLQLSLGEACRFRLHVRDAMLRWSISYSLRIAFFSAS